MPWFRAYIDKKQGGEHVRVEDGEAKDAAAYEKALKLKRGEQLGQVVELTFDPTPRTE